MDQYLNRRFNKRLAKFDCFRQVNNQADTKRAKAQRPEKEAELAGTVDKALELLGYFSEARPAIGQSEMARLSGFDKATTRRLLLALARHGMIEQIAESRKYRLGAALLRLARVRNATYPVDAVVQPIVDRLVEQTRETAHCSLVAGDTLATISTRQSPRANRVSMERGEVLPLHATASGNAYLAFAPPEILERALSRTLIAYTDLTPTAGGLLRELIDRVRRSGVAVSDQGFESEVVGIAAPIFDIAGHALGAIAVATPSSRMTATVKDEIGAVVRQAALDITQALGGAPHPVLLGEAA